MKKFNIIIILLLPVVLIAINGYSQDKPLKFGVRLGTSLTMTNLDIVPLDKKPRFVLNFGAFGEYWFSKTFGLQGNLIYNKKGAKWGLEESAMGFTVSVDVNWSLDYLSIPVYGKVAFGDRTKLYLLFGPEFSFLLSSKSKYELTSNVPGVDDESSDDDLKDFTNSFELAAGGGLGVEIPVGESLILFIDSRSSLSITKVFKEIPPMVEGVGPDESVRNLIGTLNVGLIF